MLQLPLGVLLFSTNAPAYSGLRLVIVQVSRLYPKYLNYMIRELILLGHRERWSYISARKLTITAMTRKPKHRCCSVPNFGEVNSMLGNQLKFTHVICGLCARWSRQVSKHCGSAAIILG